MRMKCQRSWRGKGWNTSGWMRGASSRSSDDRLAPRIHPEVFQAFPRQLRWHFMRMG